MTHAFAPAAKQKAAGRGRVVNQTELADILGVSKITINTWQAEGLPVKLAPDGSPRSGNQYNTAEAIRWWIAREVEKERGEDAKDRLARLQGDKIAQDMAERNGRLIPVEEIEPAWSNVMVGLRQTMLGLSGPIASATAVDDIGKARITEIIEGALSGAALTNPLADTEQEITTQGIGNS